MTSQQEDVIPRSSRDIRRNAPHPPRRRRSIRTYAFLWPVSDPLSLGSKGSAGAVECLPGGLTHNPPVGLPHSGGMQDRLISASRLLKFSTYILPHHQCSSAPHSGLPSWLYGLHSIRYSPGPDWIEPSEQDAFQAMVDRIGGIRDAALDEMKPSLPKVFSAVLWITGVWVNGSFAWFVSWNCSHGCFLTLYLTFSHAFSPQSRRCCS